MNSELGHERQTFDSFSIFSVWRSPGMFALLDSEIPELAFGAFSFTAREDCLPEQFLTGSIVSWLSQSNNQHRRLADIPPSKDNQTAIICVQDLVR